MHKFGLIGHTGFVGTTLARQAPVNIGYRSTDIHEIAGAEFDLLVCAGAPAQKWRANQDPESDRASLALLSEHLLKARCRRMVLVSTVDVFGDPVGVDESSTPGGPGTTPYGLHRLELENLVSSAFDATIVRLPGLVGPGLKKNAVYDLMHDNSVDKIDSRAQFQFYPMVNLWSDIQDAISADIPLIHLTSEPVTVGAIAEGAFGRAFVNETEEAIVKYDFRSRYSQALGGVEFYTYTARETMLAIRAYAQSTEALAKGAS